VRTKGFAVIHRTERAAVPSFGYRRRTVSTDDPISEPPIDEPTGSGLAAEKARRLAQLDDLRAEGVTPYPYRFDRTHTVADVRARWG
jgi:hypothetical protein